MEVFKGYPEVPTTLAPTAVAIGVFDGVHRGHQALLNKAVALANRHDLRSMAFTFDPHPARVLNAALAPPLTEPIERRLERIKALSIHTTVVQPFTLELAAMGAEAFVHDVLVRALQAKHVVVGAGFSFGRKQQGTVALLQGMGRTLGFDVHAIDHIKRDGIEASSTKVREFIHLGQVGGANLLLGRCFALYGEVVKGFRRGITLGFPTANVAAVNELQPQGGVYAGYGTLEGTRYPSVINIGTAPTFGASTQVKVEAHLLDYTGPDFYGAQLTVELVDLIRRERRFDGPDALKAQIKSDVEVGRRILAKA